MHAVGVHCFAGGFTQGVCRVCEVSAQLETSDFGYATASRVVPVVIDPMGYWPRVIDRYVDLLFGNPRCTAFSSLSGGCSARRRGPSAEPTTDIRQLCALGRGVRAKFVVFESVCQALSVGRPLIEEEQDKFLEMGYDVSHVTMNVASLGSAQRRRRYFFVASKTRFTPTMRSVTCQTTTRDVIERLEPLSVREMHPLLVEDDPDVHRRIKPDDRALMTVLLPGMNVNRLYRTDPEAVERAAPRVADRGLFSPYGRPCSVVFQLSRLIYDDVCPTLHSGADQYIHPRLDRLLSIRELASLMGWDSWPVGEAPVRQLVKGLIPAAGEWIARQVEASLDNAPATREVFYHDFRQEAPEWTSPRPGRSLRTAS